MSTKRPIDNNIISSGKQNSTVRNDGPIISSGINNPQIISSSLTDEIILNGKKYKISKQVARSGEAEVFLVNQNGACSIFKYYYSQYKPKDEILKKLKGLKHPDIITLIDFGYYQDRFFEISEYAQGGTLMEIMPVTSIKKIKEIVEETIEALNYCHNHGIIHRDIKPENIFYRTADKKDIAIGDFGIASNIIEGEERILTSSAKTDLYAAPEIFTNIKGKTIIEKSVDYYSLGMTLLHLWFGRNPFGDLGEYSIMRLKTEGKVLFPDNINENVEKLIKGLITVNTHERWGYNEVKQWLKGEDVKVHYQTLVMDYKPYSFGLIEGKQIVANNPKDIALYLEKYPDKGEGHLYRNTIAKWIEPVDPGLFNELMDIVEKDYPRDKTAGLTKAIYILDREMPFRGFDKTILITQEEIALYFEKNFSYYQKDLQNPNAAFYLFLEARELKNEAIKFRNWLTNSKILKNEQISGNLSSTLATELEKINKPISNLPINDELALNTLILYLQGNNKFIIDNYTIHQPEELIKVDNNTKAKIINQLSNINSKLSLWISSFKNIQPTIDKWRIQKRYDETTLRYALQQGYELNGSFFYNLSGFQHCFKNNFTNYFAGSDTSKIQSEANYWLKNYNNYSFVQSVIDYIKTENYSAKEFSQMIVYILDNYKETGKDIYQIIEILLFQLKNKTENNGQLFNNLIEIHVKNIENYWVEEYQKKSLRFLDCINNYLSFIEKNINLYTQFLSQLTLKLDNKISASIRLDIDKIKNDENQIKTYSTDLAKTVNRLKKINSELPYLIRYEREIEEINNQSKLINGKIQIENKGKTEKLDFEYDKILTQRKNEVRSTFKLTGWDGGQYLYIVYFWHRRFII